MPFHAVLLDLYDTLVWGEWEKWQQTFAARLGVGAGDMERAFVETRAARNAGAYGDGDGDVRAVLAALGVPATPALLAALHELEDREIFRDIHLYEDSLPVVRELRRRGVKTALVSNCSNNTRAVVERLGLPAEFDTTILSFEVRTQKPEPEIYRLALDRLEIADPSTAVFVDDQAAYCDGAAALGIDTRLILRPNGPPDGFAPSTNGHRVITDLTALL